MGLVLGGVAVGWGSVSEAAVVEGPVGGVVGGVID